jgi:hypothetical protein
MMTLDERYFIDAKFRAVVDYLIHLIRDQEFTPTEMREAATLAQIKYEMAHPRPLVFSADLTRVLRQSMSDGEPSCPSTSRGTSSETPASSS